MFPIGILLLLAGYTGGYVAAGRLMGAQDTIIKLCEGSFTRSSGLLDNSQLTTNVAGQ